MTKQIFSAHPALTAIAAGLAFASTPALARTMDSAPADVAPTPTTAPVAPATTPIIVPSETPAVVLPGPSTSVTLPQITPPTPATAPAAPMAAAPVPVVPTLPAIAVQRAEVTPAPVKAPVDTRRATPAEAAPAEKAVTQRESRAEPVNRAVPAAPAMEATTAEATQPGETPATLPTMPLVDPMTLDQPADQTAQAPVAQATEPSGNEALWVVGGAGAALLLGVGSLVFLRRRNSNAAVRDDRSVLEPKLTESPAAIPAATAMPARDPAAAQMARESAAAPVWTPAQTAPTTLRGAHSDDLEAMVALAPSADNPFLTRRKRLRRATFLMERGYVPTAIAPERAVAAERAPVTAKQEQTQPVYSFGNRPVSFRPQGWKPATN